MRARLINTNRLVVVLLILIIAFTMSSSNLHALGALITELPPAQTSPLPAPELRPIFGWPSNRSTPPREDPSAFSRPEVWNETTIPGAGDLKGIAALSPDNVWVIGQRSDVTNAGFIAQWNGEDWRRYSISGSQPDRLYLEEISAQAPDNIWVLGHTVRIAESVILRWDGRDWKVIPSPNYKARPGGIEPLGTPSVRLRTIAALAANDVWAAGQVVWQTPEGRYTSNELLMMHWDGSQWTRAELPYVQMGSTEGGIDEIVAVSSKDIWAVGESVYLHWDGTAWEVPGGPAPSALAGGLFSNSAVLAANNIWLVSYFQYIGGMDKSATSATHWNGQTWNTKFDMYDPGMGSPFLLRAIDGKSTNNVWAVGVGSREHVIMRWDGSEWLVTSCPGHPVGNANESYYIGGRLTSVTVVSLTEIWAVGYDGLLLQYTPGWCP